MLSADCLRSKGYWVQVELFGIDWRAQFSGGAVISSKNTAKIIKHSVFIRQPDGSLCTGDLDKSFIQISSAQADEYQEGEHNFLLT